MILNRFFLLIFLFAHVNGSDKLDVSILNCETLKSVSIEEQSCFTLNRYNGKKKTNFTCYIHLDALSGVEVPHIIEALQQHLTDRRSHFALGWIDYEQGNGAALLSEYAFSHFVQYYEMGGRDASTLEMIAHQYQNIGKIDEALACLKSAASEQMIKRSHPHYFVRLLYINSIINETERYKLLSERNYTYTAISKLALFSSKYLLLTLGIDDVSLATKSTQMIKYLKHTKLSPEDCGLDPRNNVDLIVYWRIYFDMHKKVEDRSIKEYDAYIKQKYFQRSPLRPITEIINSPTPQASQTRKVQFETDA